MGSSCRSSRRLCNRLCYTHGAPRRMDGSAASSADKNGTNGPTRQGSVQPSDSAASRPMIRLAARRVSYDIWMR